MMIGYDDWLWWLVILAHDFNFDSLLVHYFNITEDEILCLAKGWKMMCAHQLIIIRDRKNPSGAGPILRHIAPLLTIHEALNCKSNVSQSLDARLEFTVSPLCRALQRVLWVRGVRQVQGVRGLHYHRELLVYRARPEREGWGGGVREQKQDTITKTPH